MVLSSIKDPKIIQNDPRVIGLEYIRGESEGDKFVSESDLLKMGFQSYIYVG
ncbi:hypothetical protein Scep_030065 [Stephania cephalantha]|uniref:Uncharacterized protein n=1 Tax=Stephania cephalantha TaxID=152367 RepID=A0AAP0HE09_9MAGN